MLNLQVIVPVSWICGIILNLPPIIVKVVIETKSGNSCMSIFPDAWMGQAYSVAWFVGVFIPLIVMIGLYSRVVYALWFKGNDGNQLTQQQKVSLVWGETPLRKDLFPMDPQILCQAKFLPLKDYY